MISCAAIQKLERYGDLGLKRHSTAEFISTSIKDAKRTNVYALTQWATWQEAVQAVRGNAAATPANGGGSDGGEAALLAAPARFTDALVYAMSFSVAIISQHLLEVSAAATSPSSSASSSLSSLFPDRHVSAMQLLTTLKDMSLAIGSGRALRDNAASDEFTKAAAHLLTNVVDLVLVLLSTFEGATPNPNRAGDQEQLLLAQGLVMTASVAQMLRRVQSSYPVADLYNTRTCAAVLKQLANKHKQEMKARPAAVTTPTAKDAGTLKDGAAVPQSTQPLLELLRRYVRACAAAATTAAAPTTDNGVVSAASVFATFSLFQRLSVLHGALAAAAASPGALPATLSEASVDVQHWLSQLLSATACNRATRYVVYLREDELRLMQHNIRQASDYSLYTFVATPPVDPGVVEQLISPDAEAAAASSSASAEREKWRCLEAVTHTRAALVLAQWCVAAPFFFESFCQDETWAVFAQEQRRRVLLHQSRARRGLERSSKSKRERRGSQSDDASSSSRAASVSSRSSDTRSEASAGSHCTDHASLASFRAASRLSAHSMTGSVTSLASRVSLLSTFSKHSAASYLSFLSVVKPTMGAGKGHDGEGGEEGERQLHESEDGNTNLPLILLEQLTLGLYRFMEAYPVNMLDAYGLRSIAWTCLARMFGFVEASLTNATKKMATAGAVPLRAAPPQPLFTLAQDIRYNKGMGYECLGLLFAKALAPLLDVAEANESPATAATQQQRQQPERVSHTSDSDEGAHVAATDDDANSLEGDRTEEGFFANAAPAATVGRARLCVTDDADTRRSIEASLSRCLTAYESVAPQVVDMNLTTILRLAARTTSASAAIRAAASGGDNDGVASTNAVAWSAVLVDFLRDITRRLGRNNELPHLLDALLGRGEAAAAAAQQQERNHQQGLRLAAEGLNLSALRLFFRMPAVRGALVEAAGVSLDPESVLLHLTAIAAELEEDGDTASTSSDVADNGAEEDADTAVATDARTAVQLQRVLMALEVTEAVLEGVVPTSVSASAVLEQTTQLELLLTSSFMKSVEAAASAAEDAETAQQQRRQVVVQHMCTIRQCRAVTALCLQDLGSQQVGDYLLMLDKTLWQLSTDIGQLIGSLTLSDLQPWVVEEEEERDGTPVSQLLLLPSLVLQRLSLARAVTAALGTTAGPPAQLKQLVAYIWDCLGGKSCDGDAEVKRHSAAQDTRSLLLANAMSGEDWVSAVALGKERHARAAMVRLLVRSTNTTAAVTGVPWLQGCLRSIPGTALRALVDVYMRLSTESVCEAIFLAEADAAVAEAKATQQWFTVLPALLGAYAVVGHNPFWPSVLTHSVRAITRLTRFWRTVVKSGGAVGPVTTKLITALSEQLLSLVVCVLRSEPRAIEVLRKALLSQVRASVAASAEEAAAAAVGPALSRSGMSVAYVESIKVPATVLSDLSAPPGLADADAEEQAAQLARLQDLCFEAELCELCELLFDAGFVKRLLSLADLPTTDTETAVKASSGRAALSSCMTTLAILYQVCLTTAQTAWRARVTVGNLDALRRTAPVIFLRDVAQHLHTRLAGGGASASAALLAFLEPMGGEVEDSHLFVHIASQRAPAAAAPLLEGGLLESVEAHWKCLLCRCASSVAAELTTEARTATTTTTAALFLALFARMWRSSRLRHHSNTTTAAAGSPTGVVESVGGKRGRRGSAATSTADTDATTAVVASAASAFLTDLLANNASEDVAATEHRTQAQLLMKQLTHLFSPAGSSGAGDAAFLQRLRAVQHYGEESTVCACWLLWMLHTSAAATHSSTQAATREAATHVESPSPAAAGDAVALRAGCHLLRILPADALPPLFFAHLHAVLTRVIADVSSVRTCPAETRCDAVAAALEALLELFRVRPRLPPRQLLPHAQRLFVWLSHPSSGPTKVSGGAPSSSPSLSSRVIQLCGAVAAHPAVTSSAAGERQQRQAQLHARGDVVASELLDNVWLLLLSLLQGGANTVELHEAEIIEVVLLLCKTWLRSPQQQLWLRPALLPPLMSALFTCVMRGVEATRYSSRVLNVLAGGLAAVAAHVDAATAAESDADLEDAAEGEVEEEKVAVKNGKRYKSDEEGRCTSAAAHASAPSSAAVSASLKRMALTATTTALFEVSQHYVHVFTSYSSDTDFLFTDFLRVLSQHFLPNVTRPPIAYHAGVHIGGALQSEMTFADLAYMCVGNAESKSLLKQAALRMEEEDGNSGMSGSGVGLTDGRRTIFRVA